MRSRGSALLTNVKIDFLLYPVQGCSFIVFILYIHDIVDG